VNSLWLIRFFTLTVAVLYSVYYAPMDRIMIHFGVAISGTGDRSALLTAGAVGIFATAGLSVALAFFAIPRWSSGVRALSWCFLVMGLSLLTRLDSFWRTALPVPMQITSYAHTLLFALPPFILAAMLRRPPLQDELRRTP
jgi:hypothetical protein